MAAQDVAVELYYDAAWHRVEPEVFTDQQIIIDRGQTSSESLAPRSDSLALTFNNGTDKYRPSNPTSPLYGKAGRNTPLRASVSGKVRGTVEATSWQPDRTLGFKITPPRGRAWVDVEGNGVLDRIGQWTEVLRSPFYRYHEALTTSVGYWSFEDDRGSTVPFTPTAGTRTGRLTGVTFGSQFNFAGSAPLADFANNPTTHAGGYFVPGSPTSTAGWQISWCGKYGTLPGVGELYEFFDWSTSDGTTYSLNFYNGGDLILLASKGGTTVIGSGTGTFTGVTNGTDWNKWNCFVVTGTQSGGTTTISVYWMTEDSDVFAGAYTATFTGNTSSLLSWGVGTGSAKQTVTMGHVIGTTGTADNFLSAGRVAPFKGWAGERAADRFARLCTEKNIAYTVVGSAAGSWPMGPQQTDTFYKLLEEAVRTEDGLLFDDRDQIRLAFRTRGSRYNQTAALALTYPTDVYDPFAEKIGAVDVHNRVTVSQRNGGSYEKILSTGPVGTLPAPDGVGEYRQTVDVNTAYEPYDLPVLTGWWLGRGTVETSRFSAVTVNLTERADLVTAASNVDIGDRITITGYVEYVIDLAVIGIRETIGSHERKITYTCIPGRQFLTGVYDGTTRRRDSKTTTLNAAVTSTATTLVFKTTDPGDLWRPGGGGYDVMISGEQITVPAAGMGAVTGTGPYTQTATGCTRSVNGVVKALSAGEPIHVLNPARYAL
jgi:hypothetical protein